MAIKTAEVRVGYWGRSLAIRLPAALLNDVSITKDDVLKVTPTKNGFSAFVVRDDDLITNEDLLIDSIRDSK